MSKHSKRYVNTMKEAPKSAVSIAEAIKFIKAHPGSKKFDETLDVCMRLGADITKTDTPVRGVVKPVLVRMSRLSSLRVAIMLSRRRRLVPISSVSTI